MKFLKDIYTEKQIKEKFNVDKETFEKICEDIEEKYCDREDELANLEFKYNYFKTLAGILGILALIMGVLGCICIDFSSKGGL